MGQLTAPLGRHDSGRFDRTNALEVEVGPDRTLESRGEAAVLNGANAAAVRSPSGAWEVLQFCSAELIGPGRYRLTGLLRGQAGTEDAIGDPTPEGAAFVLIDARTPSSAAPEADRGRTVAWRAGPVSRPRDDATFVQIEAVMGARGLMPLAPVHLSARRDFDTGDVTLSWIRRTRLGGDDFEIRDVRLGEDSEAYEAQILDGDAVVRTISTVTPSAVYLHDQQLADFGAEPATIEIVVRQLSATVGPGLTARATVTP